MGGEGEGKGAGRGVYETEVGGGWNLRGVREAGRGAREVGGWKGEWSLMGDLSKGGGETVKLLEGWLGCQSKVEGFNYNLKLAREKDGGIVTVRAGGMRMEARSWEAYMAGRFLGGLGDWRAMWEGERKPEGGKDERGLVLRGRGLHEYAGSGWGGVDELLKEGNGEEGCRGLGVGREER
ncbi:hypothetical protein Tco_1145139 [Tanacetum coccineum]